MTKRYAGILFDLLTGLLDSWSVWNRVARSQSAGKRWRAAYLELTYGCGAYLEAEWNTLEPRGPKPSVLRQLAKKHRLGIVTNCSERLGRAAAASVRARFDVIVTSERAGFYKPHPRPYELALSELNRVGLARPAGAPAPMREARSFTDLIKEPP